MGNITLKHTLFSWQDIFIILLFFSFTGMSAVS